MSKTIVAPAQQYRPLNYNAYESLRDAIIKGRLTPGERIVEAEIARQMEISRAPIREAIRKLEWDGLVEYVPRRGTVVVKLSKDDVRDAYYLRALLESYAAGLAATRAIDDDLRVLHGLIERMAECAAGDDLSGLVAADVEFHGRICQASGSKRLYRLWDSLNPHSWTLLSSHKIVGYTLSQIAERHRPILEALEARNPERARTTIHSHITELADNVLAQMEKI